MAFQPYPTRSGFVALGIAILSGIIITLLLDSLTRQHDLPNAFGLIAWLLLAVISFLMTLYWAIIAFNLRYHLDRNGLAIQWGPSRYLIPFNQIKTIIPGKNLSTLPTFRGVNLAGLRYGRGKLAEYGHLTFHTTTDFADSLIIVTPHHSYVISPDQPENFIKAWQLRQTIGPTQQWSMGLNRNRLLKTPLITDRLAQILLGISALLCFALLGYLAFVFSDLPTSLPIRFNDLGEPSRIVEKSVLVLFPAVGVAVMALNALLGTFVYTKENVAAYLLWGSTILVQMSLWIALLYIITT